MKRILKFVIFTLILLSLLILFIILGRNGNMQLLNPQGYIAQKESILLFIALMIGLVVGVPVVAFTLLIAFKYREENAEKNYSPDWKPSKSLTAIWWVFPAILCFFWAILGWQTAHLVDPFAPIKTTVKPVNIEVVSLPWKWLFIYPEQHIATVNYIEFPANTPVNFQLTADNMPMNSFWIPSLGSQIYTMTSMVTQVHLITDETKEFPGGGTEMDGEGFAGMTFTAKSTSTEDFNKWVESVQGSKNQLNQISYNDLLKPSTYNKEASYSDTDPNLFSEIIMKYMAPDTGIYTIQPKNI